MLSHIKIHGQDNVVVALQDLTAGQSIQLEDRSLVLLDPIKRGHKIAIHPIAKGENILKYGYAIGHAIQDIGAGEHVHTHNTKTNLSGLMDYQFHQKLIANPYQKEGLTFQGYKRKNGKVGIRNELWIVPTVGCVNGVAEKILQQFKDEVGDIAPFDNALVLKHNYGCSQLGEDHENTKNILANIIKHPNAGGVLVLGLGCENNNIDQLKVHLGDFDEERVKFLTSQAVTNEFEEGVKRLRALYAAAKEDKREAVDVAELKVGLKCGGSDGLSGITANPLLGKFSDFLVAQGGSSVLTEVPEMFGAETILMERAENQHVFEKTVALINDFKQYFIKNDQEIYENPSPGNKEGGITTLEDKSLGCTQKSGTSAVVDVLNYGEVLSENGLNLLSAPGNDLVASSALAASGCHLVLFTTGRGTPFGTFVPTMKISTNSAIHALKPHWIDFNAGILLEQPMDLVLRDFIDYCLKVASGEQVNNEKNNFREIAIFKSGVTL